MFNMQGDNTTLDLELKNGRVKDEELDPKISFLEVSLRITTWLLLEPMDRLRILLWAVYRKMKR